MSTLPRSLRDKLPINLTFFCFFLCPIPDCLDGETDEDFLAFFFVVVDCCCPRCLCPDDNERSRQSCDDDEGFLFFCFDGDRRVDGLDFLLLLLFTGCLAVLIVLLLPLLGNGAFSL